MQQLVLMSRGDVPRESWGRARPRAAAAMALPALPVLPIVAAGYRPCGSTHSWPRRQA
jgi:hypothetical protein